MRRQFISLMIAYDESKDDPKDWAWNDLTGARVEVTAASDPVGICPVCGR